MNLEGKVQLYDFLFASPKVMEFYMLILSSVEGIVTAFFIFNAIEYASYG